MVNVAKCTIHGSSGIKNWMGPYQQRASRYSGFFRVRSGTVLSKISWNKHIPQMVVKNGDESPMVSLYKSFKNKSPSNQQIQVDWPSWNPLLNECECFFPGSKPSHVKIQVVISTTWNAKCPSFLGNFTPKTSNYCLKNRVLGLPGIPVVS